MQMLADRSHRRLLVTGSSGFIGQNFVQAARARGHEVWRVVRTQQASKAVDTILFDGDAVALSTALQTLECDTIVHCAAAYSPADAPEQTASLVDANMCFALGVLQAGRVAGIERFVNLGTLWEHNSAGDVSPINLYSQMKLAFQGCLNYFAEAHRVQSITLKLADTYAEHDTRGKLLSLLRDSARAGTVLEMTNGYQIINPVHVDDVCDAMLLAVDYLHKTTQTGHVFYVVDGDTPSTVRDLVARAQAVWSVPLKVSFGAVQIDGRKPLKIWTEGPRLPGWAPKVTLLEGLMRMAP